MAFVIGAGVFVVGAGLSLIYWGINHHDDANRLEQAEEREALTNDSLDSNTCGLVMLDKGWRDKMKIQVAKLTSLYQKGQSSLNPMYALNACINSKNNLAIYFKRKEKFHGIILAEYKIVNSKLTVDLDVVLAQQGDGKLVLQPLVNLEFKTFRTAIKQNFKSVCFTLKSVPNKVDFYKKHNFEVVGDAESGLTPMELNVKVPLY